MTQTEEQKQKQRAAEKTNRLAAGYDSGAALLRANTAVAPEEITLTSLKQLAAYRSRFGPPPEML